jgi:hypothetical protein
MSDEFELKICCMGAGYVGGPTMAVIAKMCPKVSFLTLVCLCVSCFQGKTMIASCPLVVKVLQ